MYNLFAILRDKSVTRIKLDNPSQKALTFMFENQAEALLHDDRERHKYAPAFSPTDGGIIQLKFKLPAELARLAPTVPNNVPPIPDVEREFARALVGVDAAAGRFVFQTLDSRSFLNRKRGVLLFGEGESEVKDVAGIVLGSKLDALFENGNLFFTSETVVRRFLDLDTIFRNATDAEIVEVLTSDKFTGFDADAVLAPDVADTWVRRKVMLIKELKILDTVRMPTLKDAADKCKIELEIVRGKIKVPTDKKELKRLLKFLSEDILESPLRAKTLYEVSGKRSVD